MTSRDSERRADEGARAAVRGAAHPLAGAAGDYDPLLDLVGDACLVLLGEASHGTHEFYRLRAEITARLIRERGFAAVVAEADWPSAYRVDRYVRGAGEAGGDATAVQALRGFRRFPRWMWRNADVRDFVEWLRAHNDALPPPERAGFYGFDVKSLFPSAAAVVEYLDRVDPAGAERARARYACFEAFAGGPQGGEPLAYGRAAHHGRAAPCEEAAAAQLEDLLGEHRAAGDDDEAHFAAVQNARLVVGAARYFRAVYEGPVASWNVRDRYMMATVDEVLRHLGRRGRRPAKLVLWAHNSHLGDARATERTAREQLNVGQLARERYGRDAVLVGFTTYAGAVTAAPERGLAGASERVRPALAGSYERLFHEVAEDAALPRFLLLLRDEGPAHAERPALREALAGPRLERAIGAVYRPGTERQSHYLYARLPDQFDAVLHVDATRAVELLDR